MARLTKSDFTEKVPTYYFWGVLLGVATFVGLAWVFPNEIALKTDGNASSSGIFLACLIGGIGVSAMIRVLFRRIKNSNLN